VSEPPEEAYSRVTNPERFRPLHALADAVVEALLQSYEIESVEHGIEITYVGAVRPTERSIRIVPAGGGAPVLIGWTPFPGLLAQFATARAVAFPGCGCDACNDDTYGVFEEFHRDLWRVVNGDYQEWVADGTRYYGSESAWSGEPLADSEDASPWRSDWRPWIRLRHW
jgi:hypothetical protein